MNGKKAVCIKCSSSAKRELIPAQVGMSIESLGSLLLFFKRLINDS